MSTPTATPDVMAIGQRLVALCEKHDHETAIRELYADDIVSIEASDSGEFPREMTGMTTILDKNARWLAANELHEASYCGPHPNGNRFAVGMRYDITPKEGPMAGQRMTFNEVGLYTVTDGKISREEFFYAMG